MIESIDYSKIFLTKSERQFLRKLKRKKRLPYSPDIAQLFRYNFIEHEYTGEKDSFGCSIPSGNVIISKELERFEKYRLELHLAHLPNWFAIIISAISLILSIVALL